MSVIDSLIQDHAPKAQTFDVPVGNVTFAFSVVPNYSAWLELKRGAEQFAEKLQGGKGVPPAWAEYPCPDKEAASMVWILSRTCRTEGLNEYEFLKLQAKLPFVFELLRTSFAAKQMELGTEAEIENLDELKNDSGETP